MAGQGGGGAGNIIYGNNGQSTTNRVSPNNNGGGRGGNGGGALRIYTLLFRNNGTITCDGDNGYLGQSTGGGGGGGGYIRIRIYSENNTLAGIYRTNRGVGGGAYDGGGRGGNGSAGIINVISGYIPAL